MTIQMAEEHVAIPTLERLPMVLAAVLICQDASTCAATPIRSGTRRTVG